MTGVRVIAIATVRECTRRRVFGVIVVLTALFLALYTLGTVTASFGVAAYPEHGAGWAELTNAADHAQYDAKAEGRDRVVVARNNPPGERPAIQLVPATKAGAGD